MIVERYLELGIEGITLADTTGMANPRQVAHLVRRVLTRVASERLSLHFHNTRGLGGCPFAPGASENVCTEDLVGMACETGLQTGVDLDRLMALSRGLPTLIGYEGAGQVAKAARPSDLHPAPA